MTNSSSGDDRSLTVYRSGLFLLGFLVAISILVGGATADGHERYVVEQGDETHTVGAIVDNETTAEDFYDYRAPNTDPHAYTYSSHGTMEYQQDDASILLLYDGPEGASLVVVHDRYREDQSEGTRGGAASFEVSGLPTDGAWVVEDDDYDGQTDMFIHDGSESELHWVWSTGRTDGAVFTGIEADSEITIDPRFNEYAELERRFATEDGVISDWQLIDATDDGFDRVSLSSLEEPLTIRQADSTELRAELSATEESSVGDAVTFDASGSEPASEIDEYRWDLTGDGNIDEVSETPTEEHRFEEGGEYTVTVTVVDEDGDTDSATTTVSVSPAVEAQFEANTTTVSVGGSVGFDASSAVGTDLSYEWSIGGETTTGSQVEREFDSTGVYDVALTVTDAVDRMSQDSMTIEVLSPTASLSAPGEAIVGETVELRADESSGFVGNVEYEWQIENERVATTAESTYETPPFEEAGEYNLSVTVTDSPGREDTATASIEISEAIRAAPAVSNDSVVEGEAISFDASGSTGSNLTYEWTFHDGEIETGAQVNRTFDDAGTYDVMLTAADGEGQMHSNTTTIDVRPDGPTASLSAPLEATVGETIELNASRSSGLEGNESYEWSIDGETVDTTGEPVTTIAFDTAGSVDVSVTVTDEAERSDIDATTVSVSQAVEARFEANTTTAEVGEPIEFDANSSTGSDLTHEWTFGDGNNATGERITHTFDTEDEYVVELTVLTADGESDVAATNVTVAGSEEDGSGDSDGEDSSSSSSPSGSGSSTSSESGGSGGSSGASSPSEITADVTTDDSGTVRLNASNVEPGVPIVADIGVGDAVRLESVTIEPGDTHDEFTATIARPEGQTPPGLPSEDGGVFDINATESIASVEYEFSVAAETIRSADIDWENLTAYRFDDGWVELDPVVEDDGDRYRMAIGVDGDEQIGIGSIEESESPEPTESTESVGEISLIDVRLGSDRIEAGETVTVTGVFENDGTAPSEYQAELLVEGSTAAIENVTVDPNGTGTITFEQRFENPGSFEIGVDDRTKAIHVAERDTAPSSEPGDGEQGFGPGLTFLALIVGIGGVSAISLFIAARKRGRTLR